MVKDFNHFVDHTGPELVNMMTNNLLTDQIWCRNIGMLRGDQWKDIRSTFSPIFTSGRIKGMSTLIEGVATIMLESVKKDIEKCPDSEIDVRTLFSKFSMDGIASCAFGVDAQSFTNSQVCFLDGFQ